MRLIRGRGMRLGRDKESRPWLRRGGLILIVGAVLLSAMFAFQQPRSANASTNPGLDAGNAQVTTVGSDTVLQYKTPGNSTFKAPAGVTNVRVLVVGAGGGGGAGELINQGDGGGGGGAGEYTHQTSQAVTPGQAVTVTVGGGGAGSTTKQNDGGTTAQNGSNGGNSVFGGLTARGGGGGGGNDQAGLAGGSGGGGGGHCTNSSTPGGASTAVAPGIGKAGGSGASGSCTPRGASGGGGAGAVGTNASGGSGATGGVGLQNDITGTNVFYAAGGGGGGSASGTGANGGSNIGGNGGNGSGGSGTVGTVNTGSGGGGGGSSTSTSGGNGGTGGSGIVIVRFATQNIPDQLGMTGLRMWYKADGAGNTNALWKDSSGFAYDITQGTAAKQPALTQGAINFNPAYVFDGTDDAFSMPTHGILGSDPMTAFYGATATRTDGGYRYFEEFGDDTPSLEMNNGKPELYVRGTSPLQLTYPTVEALVPHVYSFVSPNANNQPRIVGVDNNEQSQNVTTGVYTTTSGSQAGNTFGRTNGSGGTSWAGPIAEALYFNRVLTAQERQKINSYLAVKYGTTLGAGATAYLDSGGAQTYPADATYKNNIAGIGRDDTMTLNQKQSKSTADGDIVTMGNGGTIAATNQANTNNFTADKSFLLWGHNGAATNQSTTVDGAYIRMNRIWKAVKTNTVGQVKIQIPTSAVAAISGNSGILYTSSSATFNAGSTRTNMTVNGSNYEATVTLPAGTSYFSFGSMAGSDLQFVSKTATTPSGTPISNYTPGEAIEYILTVKNNGPDAAGTVTVSDILPAGIVPTQGTGGGWAPCNISDQTVTCTRPSLASGVTAPVLVIDATIASSVTGPKPNSATVSVANDPDNTNNTASLTLNAAPVADLSIAKRDTTVGNPVAGTNFDYTFTVKNDGPSDVASYTITDTLPSDLTYVSSSPTTACTGSAGQNITCTGGALTNGQSAVITVTVHVDEGYAGTSISNTASVAPPAGTTDPNTGNNSSTNNTNVDVETDMSITKTHVGDFVAGEENDFTIAVHNGGSSTAPIGAITVTDTLPGNLSYVSAGDADWSCNELNGTVTCTNLVTIASLQTKSFLLKVNAEPTARGTTTNIADVSSTTPDPNMANNTATDSPNIIGEADLGITKAHVGAAFTAGSSEQYTFTVTNDGPSADSPTYTITDTLPADLSFVSATGDASCTANLQVVTCVGGEIGASAPAQVTTITVMVSGSATGTIGNTANIDVPAGTTDPNPANNTSLDNVNIEPSADLEVVSKTPNTDMTAGDAAAYTIKVHNNGPSNVSSFTVTDTLDSNLSFQPSAGCSLANTLGDGRQVVECTGGAVNSGQDAADITINVLVEPTVTPGSTISNTATVEPPAGVNDPTPGNNSGSVPRNIVASADLEITKGHTGNFTAGSDTDTYTLVVTNNGPSDASDFTVTDTLPAGLDFVSGGSTSGVTATCTNAGQIVTCTGGPSIGVGESSTIVLTVAVAGDIAGNTTLDNTASVASATPDPNTGNNTSPVDTVTIDSVADLQIEKAHVNDFTAGNPEQYYIDVINNGPSDVSGYTVTDTLPAGLTYSSSDLNGNDVCAGSSGQNVTCNGPAVASGQSVTFILTVNTSASLVAGATIDNTADVATIAPTTDPNGTNNSSTDSATVVNITDLSIVKNHTGTFTAGEGASYTMTVSNSGPSNTPTDDVQVVDTLPAGMTYESTGSGGTGWTCSELNSTVTCDYAPALAINDTTPTLTINVNIAPDKQGEVSNTATVVSRLDDSDPADDTSTDTTTIGAEADLTATKAAQGTLTAGEPVTYRFEVTNNGGPSMANGVKVTDDLQGHFTYQGFTSISGGTWNCSDSNGTVTCDLSTPLGLGDTAIVDVALIVDQNAPNPVTNSASVTFNGTDPTPANPSDTDPVAYEADLEVDITHEQKTYHAGDTINYTITTINHGPSAAKDAVLTVTIPDGLKITNVSAEAPGGNSLIAAVDKFLFPRASAANNPFSCSLNGSQLVCTAGTLSVGSYPLYVTGQIDSGFTGQLVLSAHITSATFDPNPSDATATDTVLDILAATGQNVWLWASATLVVIVGAIILAVQIRRRGRWTSW